METRISNLEVVGGYRLPSRDEKTLEGKKKAPCATGLFWFSQGYFVQNLRRINPAIPTRPVPRRPKVPGSGTLRLVSPLERLRVPLKKPLPELPVSCTVAPTWPVASAIAPLRVYECVPFDNVLTVHVMSLPVKAPLKITPLGTPFVPFPVIVNEPPAASVPPI